MYYILFYSFTSKFFCVQRFVFIYRYVSGKSLNVMKIMPEHVPVIKKNPQIISFLCILLFPFYFKASISIL